MEAITIKEAQDKIDDLVTTLNEAHADVQRWKMKCRKAERQGYIKGYEDGVRDANKPGDCEACTL